MKIDTIEKLFLEELRDVYSAEKQITRALPKMAKKAHRDELKTAFSSHLEQTKQQIHRLEQVFEIFGQKARAKKCLGMEGLISEGEEMMGEDIEAELLDVALIASAQKVEHYEMAAYGALREYAKLLGKDQAVQLLQQTLDEEGETDKKLTRLATQRINKFASGMSAGA